MNRPAINALHRDDLATHMNRRSGGLRRPQSPTDFAFWTPKKHREFHSLTATSAMVLPSSAVRHRGWGSLKRKNEPGLWADLAASEATLERAERLANLLTLSYEPMLAWRLTVQSNSGTRGQSGFTVSQRTKRLDVQATLCFGLNFRWTLLTCGRRIKDKRDWFGELRHICKDGSKVVVESHMQLFSDSLVLEANRDITKRIEIEVALRESEQRLRWLASLVEFSDDAIVSKNLDGVITSWNSGAERVFGYSASEAIGQPINMEPQRTGKAKNVRF